MPKLGKLLANGGCAADGVAVGAAPAVAVLLLGTAVDEPWAIPI